MHADTFLSSTSTVASLRDILSSKQSGWLEGLAVEGSSCLLLSDSCLNQPLSHSEALKSGLGTYFLALTIFEDAIEAFVSGNYKSFDALIGNNSCYTVSFHVFCIATKLINDEKFLKNIDNIRQKIILAKHKIQSVISDSTNKQFPMPCCFCEFLINNGLDFCLDIDIIYIAMCFGCASAKIKNEENYEEISYEKLTERYKSVLMRLNKKSTARLVKHWQRVTSYLNVKKLQADAAFVAREVRGWGKYLADDYILEDSHARLCAPSLYSLRVIYQLLLSKPKSLIGLQVNVISNKNEYIGRFTIYFEVQKNKSLKNIREEALLMDKPIYIFSGCRHIEGNENTSMKVIEESFLRRDPYDLIFAHEVTYPQYPRSLQVKNIEPENPLLSREITRLRAIKGCSIKDPSDFCTVHVYVDNTSFQALSTYEPPVYLPSLDGQSGNNESSHQAYQRCI